jgi:hypothetical protein
MKRKLMLFCAALLLATGLPGAWAQTAPAQISAQMPTVPTEPLAEVALALPKDLPWAQNPAADGL